MPSHTLLDCFSYIRSNTYTLLLLDIIVYIACRVKDRHAKQQFMFKCCVLVVINIALIWTIICTYDFISIRVHRKLSDLIAFPFHFHVASMDFSWNFCTYVELIDQIFIENSIFIYSQSASNFSARIVECWWQYVMYAVSIHYIIFDIPIENIDLSIKIWFAASNLFYFIEFLLFRCI